MAEPAKYRLEWEGANCAVIVAHPDDETLWAGGVIMMHPESRWTIVTVCRKSDADRAGRFHEAMKYLNAAGFMGDMDDGPEQKPLREADIQQTIISLLALDRFDLILTHSLWGEYTRHLRHEETARAVMALWKTERFYSKQLWMFAYEDGGGKYLPRHVRNADETVRVPEEIWQKKYKIITQVYGFAPDSFEAKTTPRTEAFWCFGTTTQPRAEQSAERLSAENRG